jgi:hypothetical protein
MTCSKISVFEECSLCVLRGSAVNSLIFSHDIKGRKRRDAGQRAAPEARNSRSRMRFRT